MTHDNSWPVALKFMGLGATRVKDTKQVVLTLDHDVQNKSEKNLEKYRNIENFAQKQGLDFYPAGRGIGHQILVEEGYAFPYYLTVASDSHSNTYGGVGCLGTPLFELMLLPFGPLVKLGGRFLLLLRLSFKENSQLVLPVRMLLSLFVVSLTTTKSLTTQLSSLVMAYNTFLSMRD